MLQMAQKNRGECGILERRKSSKRKGFEFPTVHGLYRRWFYGILDIYADYEFVDPIYNDWVWNDFSEKTAE